MCPMESDKSVGHEIKPPASLKTPPTLPGVVFRFAEQQVAIALNSFVRPPAG